MTIQTFSLETFPIAPKETMPLSGSEMRVLKSESLEQSLLPEKCNARICTSCMDPQALYCSELLILAHLPCIVPSGADVFIVCEPQLHPWWPELGGTPNPREATPSSQLKTGALKTCCWSSRRGSVVNESD